MKNRYIAVLALLALACTGGESGLASGRPAGTDLVRRAPGGIRLSFLPSPSGAPVRDFGAGQGALDLGRVSYAARAHGMGVGARRKAESVTLTTQFVLRLDSASATPAGTATLSAYLLHADPEHRYMLDGVELTTSPQVVQTQVPLGVPVVHQLKLEVSREAPAGAISNAISWIVITD